MDGGSSEIHWCTADEGTITEPLNLRLRLQHFYTIVGVLEEPLSRGPGYFNESELFN